MSTPASTPPDGTTRTRPRLLNGRWATAQTPPMDPDAPLTFDGRSLYRLPNTIDERNEYVGRAG